MRKKAQVSSTLVMMIAGLIGLMVLLFAVGGFGKIFKSITGKNECQIEFLVSSFTKAGGAQTAEPNCEPHKITISQENLTKKTEKIIKDLDEYIKKYADSDSAQKYYSEFNNNQGYKEWAMNEIIAKEMKYCWDVTGQGKLDLFSEWWSLLDCKNDNNNDYHKCTKNEVYEMYGVDSFKGLTFVGGASFLLGAITGIGGVPVLIMAGGIPLIYKTSKGDIQSARAPTFCVLCSRIKFDDNLQGVEPEINSMGSWLANNPVSNVGTGSKIPYAAYLQNDAFKGIWANKNSYKYTTNEAYAVLYARINVFKAKAWLEKLGDIVGQDDDELPEAVQVLKLVPYREIQNECTYLVG